MEKNQYDIIADMRALVNSLKEQTAALERRLAELEEVAEEMAEDNALEAVAEELAAARMPVADEPAAVADSGIPAGIDDPAAMADGDLPDEDAEPAAMADAEKDAEPAAITGDDLPAEDDEPAAMTDAEPVPMPEAPAEADPGIGDMPELDDSPADEAIDISIDIDGFPGMGDIGSAKAPLSAPTPGKSLREEFGTAVKGKSINDMEKSKVKKSVADAAREKQAWRRDMPGTPVKNIISAISLADRALLINALFKGDAIAFNDAITAFNGMASFDEAERYILEKHPGWNMNSDIVYRLMMAIRRKLR